MDLSTAILVLIAVAVLTYVATVIHTATVKMLARQDGERVGKWERF